MKHPFTHQAKRAGIALAAVAAFSVPGIGTAQAASFSIADISINSVGFLECAFKETGLAPGASVDYTCGATDVGWLTQCFIRNKPVANIAPSSIWIPASASSGRVAVSNCPRSPW